MRRGDVSQCVIQRQRLAVEPAGLVGELEQRLDLGREPELAIDFGPEQRLLAGAIAREHQALARVVPDGQPEHSLEARDGVRPKPVVVRYDRLDVAVRAERVAPGARFAAQVGRVVDLAVADHPDLAVRTLERLVAGREVHDREAPRADSGPLVSDDAFAVRAAVAERGRHSRERLRLPQRTFPPRYRAEDAAHGP